MAALPDGSYIVDELAALGRAADIDTDGKDLDDLDVQDELAAQLRGHGVFLSSPLDLDWSLLSAYPHAYTALEDGEQGPSDASAASAVSEAVRSRTVSMRISCGTATASSRVRSRRPTPLAARHRAERPRRADARGVAGAHQVRHRGYGRSV